MVVRMSDKDYERLAMLAEPLKDTPGKVIGYLLDCVDVLSDTEDPVEKYLWLRAVMQAKKGEA